MGLLFSDTARDANGQKIKKGDRVRVLRSFRQQFGSVGAGDHAKIESIEVVGGKDYVAIGHGDVTGWLTVSGRDLERASNGRR